MPMEMFNEIVKKAKSEGVSSIHLYNWTEPLVHPRIGEFIEIINSAGISSGISTNLNISKNMEQALKAEPSFFAFHYLVFTKKLTSLGMLVATLKLSRKTC